MTLLAYEPLALSFRLHRVAQWRGLAHREADSLAKQLYMRVLGIEGVLTETEEADLRAQPSQDFHG
jgi:hypothetical protein